MKLLKTLILASVLASSLAACATDGRMPKKIWRDGHRFCLAADGMYYRCDNQRR